MELKKKFKFEILSKHIGLKFFSHAKTGIKEDFVLENSNRRILEKVANDFISWKVDNFLENFIPNLIDQKINVLFGNDELIYRKLKTFDEKVWNDEKGRLFGQIHEGIIDYLLKEKGAIDENKSYKNN